MSASIASDDIVRSVADALANSRPPLLVLEPLERFLDEHGLGAGAIEASPIGEGHSNVTYLLTRGEVEIVLRRPPRPPLPPSAHDVLREARLLRALRDTPAQRRRISEQLIEALAEIHAVDWLAVGLEGFGKPTGYLERQLRRFRGLWEVNKTREIPAVERVAGWLGEHMPTS